MKSRSVVAPPRPPAVTRRGCRRRCHAMPSAPHRAAPLQLRAPPPAPAALPTPFKRQKRKNEQAKKTIWRFWVSLHLWFCPEPVLASVIAAFRSLRKSFKKQTTAFKRQAVFFLLFFFFFFLVVPGRRIGPRMESTWRDREARRLRFSRLSTATAATATVTAAAGKIYVRLPAAINAASSACNSAVLYCESILPLFCALYVSIDRWRT
jgi:hypothetical protein